MVKTGSLYLIWAPIGTETWQTDTKIPRHQDRITIADTRYMLAFTRKKLQTDAYHFQIVENAVTIWPATGISLRATRWRPNVADWDNNMSASCKQRV